MPPSAPSRLPNGAATLRHRRMSWCRTACTWAVRDRVRQHLRHGEGHDCSRVPVLHQLAGDQHPQYGLRLDHRSEPRDHGVRQRRHLLSVLERYGANLRRSSHGDTHLRCVLGSADHGGNDELDQQWRGDGTRNRQEPDTHGDRPDSGERVSERARRRVFRNAYHQRHSMTNCCTAGNCDVEML